MFIFYTQAHTVLVHMQSCVVAVWLTLKWW